MAHCEDVVRLDPVGRKGSCSILCEHPYTLLLNPDVSYQTPMCKPGVSI